jgi:hypothetical protein
VERGQRSTGPEVLDTFPAFEEFWARVRHEPISIQIRRWAGEHMGPWPELLSKQQENYSSDGLDWAGVARYRVFPHLEERLGTMRDLHRDLVRTIPGSWARARAALGIRFPIRFVIYVGIGCGEGWATIYGDRPACLFGLENAAENHRGGDGWSRRIVAHEVAHLAHERFRSDKPRGPRDPWWMLYEEGFATYWEQRIEPKLFPLRTGKKDWLAWCDEHRPWLARKFLADVAARRSLRPFFGSWFRIRGQIETGYYLGAEMIRSWTQEMPWRGVASLPLVRLRRRARSTLLEFAEESGP